jgi:isoleucyl-tRNA synthetase
VPLQPQEYSVDTVVDASGDGDGVGTGPDGTGGAVAGSAAQAVAVLDGGSAGTGRGASGFVVLDTTVTPEAVAVGLARDVVREVQKARRDAGLAVTDRIALRLGSADAAVVEAITTHRQFVAGETLADSVEVTALSASEAEAAAGTQVALSDGTRVAVSVARS